jgi:hypothetical protein
MSTDENTATALLAKLDACRVCDVHIRDLDNNDCCHVASRYVQYVSQRWSWFPCTDLFLSTSFLVYSSESFDQILFATDWLYVVQTTLGEKGIFWTVFRNPLYPYLMAYWIRILAISLKVYRYFRKKLNIR